MLLSLASQLLFSCVSDSTSILASLIFWGSVYPSCTLLKSFRTVKGMSLSIHHKSSVKNEIHEIINVLYQLQYYLESPSKSTWRSLHLLHLITVKLLVEMLTFYSQERRTLSAQSNWNSSSQYSIEFYNAIYISFQLYLLLLMVLDLCLHQHD